MKQDEIFAEMRNDPRLRPYIPVNEFYEETLQRIRKDPSLYRHVPIYAEKDFAWAIAQVRSLENSQNLRPGIHYIVLIDL